MDDFIKIKPRRLPGFQFLIINIIILNIHLSPTTIFRYYIATLFVIFRHPI